MHHGPDIIHALFQRGVGRRPVRQSRVTLVEEDQAAERGQTVKEAGRLGVFPQQIEVAHRPRHEHDVAFALSEHLVGDVDVPVLGVQSLRLGPGVRLPGGPVFERWVLAQDPRVEVAQLGPGLDPELVDEGGAQLAVGAQRVGLAPGAVQRQQALGPEPLTQRVPGGQRLEFCDRLPMASAHELRVHP